MRKYLTLPFALLGSLVVSGVALWLSLTVQITSLVQAFYVLTLATVFVVVITCLSASAAYACKRFDTYWSTGYPILLVVTISAFGFLKSPIPLSGLLITIAAFLAALLIGNYLGNSLLRFLPLTIVIVVLIVGEIPLMRENLVVICGFLAGLLLGPVSKSWKKHKAV